MESIGLYLRSERELRQISLEELAQLTRIPLRMLRRIEKDLFDELPGEVFVRGFIKSYARAIGVDIEPLLQKYGQKRSESTYHAPMHTITPPDQKRRLGVMMAVGAVFVLFTLGLSAVLQPRYRDVPMRLSQTEMGAAFEAGEYS